MRITQVVVVIIIFFLSCNQYPEKKEMHSVEGSENRLVEVKETKFDTDGKSVRIKKIEKNKNKPNEIAKKNNDCTKWIGNLKKYSKKFADKYIPKRFEHRNISSISARLIDPKNCYIDEDGVIYTEIIITFYIDQGKNFQISLKGEFIYYPNKQIEYIEFFKESNFPGLKDLSNEYHGMLNIVIALSDWGISFSKLDAGKNDNPTHIGENSYPTDFLMNETETPSGFLCEDYREYSSHGEGQLIRNPRYIKWDEGVNAYVLPKMMMKNQYLIKEIYRAEYKNEVDYSWFNIDIIKFTSGEELKLERSSFRPASHLERKERWDQYGEHDQFFFDKLIGHRTLNDHDHFSLFMFNDNILIQIYCIRESYNRNMVSFKSAIESFINRLNMSVEYNDFPL